MRGSGSGSMSHSTSSDAWREGVLATSPSNFGTHWYEPPPMITMRGATALLSVAAMDRPVGVAQRPTLLAGAQGDDLGTDRDRGLLRGTGADVEPDRGPQPLEVGVGYAFRMQPFDPVGVGAP